MIIIESLEELNKVKALADSQMIAAIPFFTDHKLHPMRNELSVIAIKINDEIYAIPLDHNESDSAWVDAPRDLNGWKFHSMRMPNINYLPWIRPCNQVDAQALEYFETGKVTPESEFYTPLMKRMHSRYQTGENVNRAIPLLNLEAYFTAYFEHILSFQSTRNSEAVVYHNCVVQEVLYNIENNGIHVNPVLFKQHFPNTHIYGGNMVYSQYNAFTTTGRITNKFDGVNYAALNTHDDTRKAFTSRYGEEGILVNIDYKSFHPLIVADLIDYKFHKPVYDTFATFLGVAVKEAKAQTMVGLYGNLHFDMKYFKKVHEYRHKLWQTIQKDGYFASPLGRRLYLSDIDNPSEAKVFNYFIQMREMEITTGLLYQFLPYAAGNVVLYTYDGILIDCRNLVSAEMVAMDTEVLTDNGKYPIRVYYGKNYGEMTEIV